MADVTASSPENGAVSSTSAQGLAPSTRGRKRKEGFAAATTASRGAAGEKRFRCQSEGCERSFTRAEHLQRHLLNHSNGDFTCARCRAHFKRRDLLGE
ncbi:hypothetical protein DM02DRAFT_613517 [Periconia macrospinosa]|uniref:C2H2-type domain-containing protein n=1 Tax=Periconia macrospinosa TaxID=97972 RepID=A0A2V1DTP1_9PLEO|nr:hypothetical protein DM02DRAFT_613517 [Periconia macrospinosa]